MNRKLAAALVFAGILATALYILPIPQRGPVGPDEACHASIARHMSESASGIARICGRAVVR